MFARTTFFVVLVLLLAVAAPLAAQETGSYMVKQGDTLWELSGFYKGDPTLWVRLLDANPFLKKPGRIFERDGRIIVLIRPGEQLKGLLELGITVEPVPLEQLNLAGGPRYHPAVEWALEQVGRFWPYLLVILGLLLVGLVWFGRVLNADPALSRPAVVPGGVTTPTDVAARLREIAARAYQTRTGQSVSAQQFIVREQVAGRIWGVLTVRYGDGREIPRRLNGERAYRGRVQYPNGQEEILYFLQACGNDLRYSGISRYLPGPEFRFEEDQPAVTTELTPQVTTAAPTPEAQPTTEPEPVGVRAEDDGTISFEYRQASYGQPALVRLRGINAGEFTFLVRENETVLRFR